MAPNDMIHAPSQDLRALKIVVVVLGVALLSGLAALVATIALRLGDGSAGAAAPVTVSLPQEARVAHIALDGDMLAVHIEKAGAEEILVVDLKSGKVTRRAALARD